MQSCLDSDYVPFISVSPVAAFRAGAEPFSRDIRVAYRGGKPHPDRVASDEPRYPAELADNLISPICPGKGVDLVKDDIP